MPCIKFWFCDCIKTSTDTDYYVDPKLFSLRKPIFEPEKIQNKVSESEFLQMRSEMATAGGKWFTVAKVNYTLIILHATLCLLFFAAKMIARVFFDKKILEFSQVIQITGLTLPHITEQICMRIFMKKACVGVQKLFDSKNEEIYSARGVHWLACGTLVYIHIKIIEDETELTKFSGGVSENNVNVFEVMNKNSNREILLKGYQGGDLMPNKVSAS